VDNSHRTCLYQMPFMPSSHSTVALNAVATKELIPPRETDSLALGALNHQLKDRYSINQSIKTLIKVDKPQRDMIKMSRPI